MTTIPLERTPAQGGSPLMAVELTDVSLNFGRVQALGQITLQLEAGRIHALVGQNGAGKSTCLGILAGRIAPTSGHVRVLGGDYAKTISPKAARERGVGAIYQELSIFPELSALENVFIGQFRSRSGFVARARYLERFTQIAARLRLSIDPNARAGDLSIANQQMIEIARALALDSKVLLLDEPTAALAPAERDALFDVMRELREDGVCLVFVSHYLDEVLEHSDTVTVFRDGHLVAQGIASEWDQNRLVATMLGEEKQALAEATHEAAAPRDPVSTRSPAPLMRISGVSSKKLRDVDIEVYPGEIVGIGGLVGSGRSSLLRAIAGAERVDAGRMQLEGVDLDMPSTAHEAWKRRIAFIPEDRKGQGLVLGLTARENVLMGDPAALSKRGFVSQKKYYQRIDEIGARYSLPVSMLDQRAGNLSGGNQQKILFARWGLRGPKILLADEATRGIDIPAKGQIMRTLRELADDGLGIVFVSSELEEVAVVSDRIYVLRGGRVVHHIENTADVTQDDILAPAFGLTGKL